MKKFIIRFFKYTGGGIFLLPLIFSLFVSCEHAPTWNEPVKEFFDYYTNSAAIETYEIVQPYLVDKDGNICLSSDGEKFVTLYARNPKKYTLVSNWAANDPDAEDGVTIDQDSGDPTVFHLKFTQNFLKEHERGGDIGGKITQTETASTRVFEKESFKLNMRCNSAPPEIDDAAVMSVKESDDPSDDSQTYVLAFTRPGKALCQSSLPLGIHHDIVSVTINGVTYPVSISDDGVMSFPEEKFTTERPANLARINRKFEPSSPAQAVYFLSGEPLIDGTKIYTIGFTDEAGLSTSITVDTQVPRICAPVVKDNDGQVISAGTSVDIHTDAPGENVSTITIEAPTMDEVDNAVSDVSINWELYSTDTGEEVCIDSSTVVGNAAVQIPKDGWYVLRTWASKAGFRESAKKDYRLNLEYPQLDVPMVKDISGTVLSDTAANNYIELDGGGKNYATVKIMPPTQTVDGASVSGSGTTTLVYTINKGKVKSSEADEIENSGTATLTDATFGQWILSVKAKKDGYNDSEEKTYLIKAFSGDLWVKAGGDNTNGDGSKDYPYATVQRAVNEIKAYNKSTKKYTVHVDGTIQGCQTVSSAIDGKSAGLTLTGENVSGVLDGNKRGATLTVSTTVPVTIEHLKITGGSNHNGGGIIINENGTVKLGNGAWVTGNEATSNGSGGGVLVDTNAKLFVYGTALIGDSGNTRPNANGNGAANKASYGGGICNWRASSEVYLGYMDEDTPYPIESGYGVRQNYASFRGAGISSWGTLKIASGEISYNYSKAGGASNPGGIGGGIYSEYDTKDNAGERNENHLGGILDISGGTIKENYAETSGGGIYYSGSSTYGGFALSGSASIPSSGTKNFNDVYLKTSSGNVSVKLSGTLSGSGTIYLDGYNSGTNNFYKYGYQALTGTYASNYTKFKVIKPGTVDWKIDSDGKVKFADDVNVTVNYNINISDDKASPAANKFGFTKSGTAFTSPDSIKAGDFGTTNAVPAKPSNDYYIGSSENIYKFNGWKNAAGTSIGSAVTKLPESLLTGLTSPSVTLNAQWSQVTDDPTKVAAWKTFVFNEDFYSKHDTFNVYTADQVKQIFDCNTAGSLCRASDNDFSGKTIYICDDINVGNIKTSANSGNDGYNAWIPFKGTLSGQGRTITANITGTGGNTGLLYSLSGGSVTSLNVSGSVTASDGGVGGIVGSISALGGTITACNFTGNIQNTGSSDSDYCGGIVGIMHAGTVSSCRVVNCSIYGKKYVGGIVGKARGESSISANYFDGTAKHDGTSGYVGKVVGLEDKDDNTSGNSYSAAAFTIPSTSIGGVTVNNSY